MSYFDPDDGAPLRDVFEDLVLAWPSVTAKTMFGCPSYVADDTLFAVLVTDGIALTRLPTDRRESLDASFETGPFQAGERTVTKWAQVTVDDPGIVDDLEPFVRASYEAALDETS